MTHGEWRHYPGVCCGRICLGRSGAQAWRNDNINGHLDRTAASGNGGEKSRIHEQTIVSGELRDVHLARMRVHAERAMSVTADVKDVFSGEKSGNAPKSTGSVAFVAPG